MSPDPDELDAVMAMLRAEYLAEVPDRLRQLDELRAAFAARTPGADDRLHRSMHQLTGSAGSYGFEEVSVIARRLEILLKPHPAPEADLLATIDAGLSEIRALFEAAGQG